MKGKNFSRFVLKVKSTTTRFWYCL